MNLGMEWMLIKFEIKIVKNFDIFQFTKCLIVQLIYRLYISDAYQFWNSITLALFAYRRLAKVGITARDQRISRWIS